MRDKAQEKEMLLSFVMSNYNDGYYLESRIDNVLLRLNSEMEFVIIDDGSTDNSHEILDRYQNDPRLKIKKLPNNRGPVLAINEGLQLARGKYAAFVACDDFLLPGFVEKTLKVLLDNPDIAICCSDFGFTTYEEPERIQTSKIIPHREITVFRDIKALIEFARHPGFMIPGHTSIVKRELVVQKGGFLPELTFACDWFLSYSLVFEHGFAYIPETLAVMRLSPDAYSTKLMKDPKSRNESHKAVFEELWKTKNKELRRKFLRSGILNPLLASYFEFYVAKQPIKMLKTPRNWAFAYAHFQQNIYPKYATLVLETARKWLKAYKLPYKILRFALRVCKKSKLIRSQRHRS